MLCMFDPQQRTHIRGGGGIRGFVGSIMLSDHISQALVGHGLAIPILNGHNQDLNNPGNSNNCYKYVSKVLQKLYIPYKVNPEMTTVVHVLHALKRFWHTRSCRSHLYCQAPVLLR